MSRRKFLGLCAGVGAGALSAGSALATLKQDTLTVPNFHILMITYRGETDVDIGFRAYLEEAGLSVRYTVHDVAQNLQKVDEILQELPALAPDLIYVWGTPLTLALVGPYDAKQPQYIRDIPVVFALVAAPLQARIVPSLQGYAGNVTGAVHVVPVEVQLRVMHSYRPFQKLGVLYNAAEPNSQAIVASAQAYCQSVGSELVARTFAMDAQGKPMEEGVEALVQEIHDAGAQWLYLLPDTFLGQMYGRVSPKALSLKLPTFGAAELAVREGGALVGLVSRYYSVGQLAGMKAVQILKHAQQPGRLPVETLKRFSLLINVRVARQLQMYPPLDMLNYAEVIAVGESQGMTV